MMKKLIMLLSLVLPWAIRRHILQGVFGYSLHPTSRIGFAWICPRQLVMGENASIGHLTVCKNIDLLQLGAHALIGQLNWITGFPTGSSRHFAHQTDRRPELILEDHAGISSKNLLVGRAALQVLDESSIGVVFTHGDPRSNGRNTLIGTDFNYTNNRVFGSKSLNAHASVQFTDSDYARGQGTAATLSCFYPNDPFEFYLFYSRIDRKYDPALGFVSRTGVEEAFQQVGYIWHPVTPLVDRVQLNAQLDWVMDLHGRVVSLDHDLPSLKLRTPAGDQLHLQYSRTADRLDDPFAIRPGIVIPVGNYGWGRFTADYNTTKSRPVSVSLSARDQGFYAGHRRDYGGGVEWRSSRFFSTSLNWQVRQIRMPQGNFAVRIGSWNAVYTFTPDLQLSLLGQYDNFSDSLGVNFRLKWIVQPGNEVFFVVNQGYDTSLDRFRPVGNETSMKAAWTFRF